jgi:hypothetical protein
VFALGQGGHDRGFQVDLPAIGYDKVACLKLHKTF